MLTALVTDEQTFTVGDPVGICVDSGHYFAGFVGVIEEILWAYDRTGGRNTRRDMLAVRLDLGGQFTLVSAYDCDRLDDDA
jgi:hypothetical protein